MSHQLSTVHSPTVLQDSSVPPETSQSKSPLGTMGCPQDSVVPPDTSQSHCSSHPKVPRGLWDVLRISLSHQIHLCHCPSRPNVPLGRWDVLRTPLSHQIHHRPTVLPVPKSQGDFGTSSGFPCPTKYIPVPLSFRPKVPRGFGTSSGFPCPTKYISVPLSFPSQSPKGTIGCPQDSTFPPDTSLSHCPSHPKVPLGQWDVLGIPLSHQIHHSPTVLPVPKSQGDFGTSSGFPCPTR